MDKPSFITPNEDGILVTLPTVFKTVTVLHRHFVQPEMTFVDCGGRSCEMCRAASRLFTHFRVPVECGGLRFFIEAPFKLYKMMVDLCPSKTTKLRIRKIGHGYYESEYVVGVV